MSALLREIRGALLVAFAALAAAAAAQGVSEPAVKAAFIYKFLGYIEYPAQAFAGDAPYVIGVVGANDVAAELERVTEGRSVNGRRVTVRRVPEGEGSVRGVHVLFVGGQVGNARELLRAVQRQPVLTITETARGLELGSVVNLVTLEDRVGFEVSQEAADRAGLNISSRMLAVARRVVPKGA
jgi:hypothetical protein